MRCVSTRRELKRTVGSLLASHVSSGRQDVSRRYEATRRQVSTQVLENKMVKAFSVTVDQHSLAINMHQIPINTSCSSTNNSRTISRGLALAPEA